VGSQSCEESATADLKTINAVASQDIRSSVTPQLDTTGTPCRLGARRGVYGRLRGHLSPFWYPTQHHPPAARRFMAAAFFPSADRTPHPCIQWRPSRLTAVVIQRNSRQEKAGSRATAAQSNSPSSVRLVGHSSYVVQMKY
jgi:hypothetical protein